MPRVSRRTEPEIEPWGSKGLARFLGVAAADSTRNLVVGPSRGPGQSQQIVFTKGQVFLVGRAPSGLYNPAYEHDACGVAMVVDMHGRRSRDIVDKAITALLNLEHRGAQGAEPNTGDGAGILLQVPDEFLRAVCAEQGEFELPEPGRYATGIAFLPQSSRGAAAACE